MINFGKDRTISVLSTSMDATAQRQRASAENIANINTPEYKRQVVDFENRLHQAIVRDAATRGKMYQTNDKHIPIKENISQIRPQTRTDQSGTMREDGNNVDIDLELALLAENTVRFNVLSETVARKYAGIKSVIRGG